MAEVVEGDRTNKHGTRWKVSSHNNLLSGMCVMEEAWFMKTDY